jgi:hypothetical protein
MEDDRRPLSTASCVESQIIYTFRHGQMLCVMADELEKERKGKREVKTIVNLVKLTKKNRA